MVRKKKTFFTPAMKLFLVILLIPVSIILYFLALVSWQELKTFFTYDSQLSAIEKIQEDFDVKIPTEYIPIYMDAGKEYNIPWTLIAAHHRVETIFSTMDPLVSPAGAEGHMQFMPCTFVGWKHPTCSGLGEGNISDYEKTNPEIIKKYGGYGIDANGDGIADPFNLEDAIYSAANFLSKAGASEGNLEKAIFQYNHSEQYVQDVLYFYEQYESVSEELEQEIISIVH